MKNIKYLSADELISLAKEKIVPIPSQENAQKEIATLIAMHLNNIKAIENGVPRDELPSLTSYILGSTGSGKSHITKNLAKICGLNFEKVDCANITQSGCRGRNLSNTFTDIFSKNPNWFDEGGIILFDEADKMRYVGDNHYDAYSPQQDFLCMLENGEITISNEEKKMTVISFDKTLILFAGACGKIAPLLEAKYRKKQALGFASDNKSNTDDKAELLSKTTLDDLKDYGFMAELCGRMQRIIYIPDIDMEGYKKLITDPAKTSALNKYKNCFNVRGVKFKITDNAVNLIAETSKKQNLGARSIESVLSKAVIEAHNYVDANSKCNEVVLTTQNDEFKLNYHNGKRQAQKVIEEPEINIEMSIYSELLNKQSIGNFCVELTECAKLSNKYEKDLFFNFVHTACFYLAYNTRPSERTYHNLIKLAQATKPTYNDPDNIAPYEIICNDYVVAAKPNDLRFQDGFLPYYINYKRLTNGADISHILTKALKNAIGPYTCKKLTHKSA